MNGVLGIGRILSETTLDDTQREYVDIICGSAQALLSLINDVLDLSKIEADRLELQKPSSEAAMSASPQSSQPWSVRISIRLQSARMRSRERARTFTPIG
jgi:signal transduction histidine kinase